MLFFMMARVSFACLGGMEIALKRVPARQMRVPGCGDRLLRRKMAFRLPVVQSSLFVMVRGIVVVPRGGMTTRHG
jgi:hypothetical protein